MPLVSGTDSSAIELLESRDVLECFEALSTALVLSNYLQIQKYQNQTHFLLYLGSSPQSLNLAVSPEDPSIRPGSEWVKLSGPDYHKSAALNFEWEREMPETRRAYRLISVGSVASFYSNDLHSGAAGSSGCNAYLDPQARTSTSHKVGRQQGMNWTSHKIHARVHDPKVHTMFRPHFSKKPSVFQYQSPRSSVCSARMHFNQTLCTGEARSNASEAVKLGEAIRCWRTEWTKTLGDSGESRRAMGRQWKDQPSEMVPWKSAKIGRGSAGSYIWTSVVLALGRNFRCLE
ncbi:hypothetical protein DFH11DRAFT_1542019 [Phellopilus nigrolimitatus]|nr:hypothetical protein DFH11DRAFT_1542019 [Phellopilus nigrolimitatus]